AKSKVMFNTPNPADRLEMVKALGYGGDISPLLAQYANQDLPKQYAIIKKGKEPPVRIRIPDVKDIDLDRKVEKAYIEKCLSNEWNHSPKEIRAQMESRFNVHPTQRTTKNTRRSGTGAKANDKASDKAVAPKTAFDSIVRP